MKVIMFMETKKMIRLIRLVDSIHMDGQQNVKHFVYIPIYTQLLKFPLIRS